MTLDDNNHDENELDFLRKRVEHLESVNRWHLNALSMLTSMEGVHGNAMQMRDPRIIFSTTRLYLQRIVDFDVMAFLAINEDDSSFSLIDSDDADNEFGLDEIIDNLINKGEFAWALSQNHPVEVRSEISPYRVILHMLTTKTRVRGMFLGIVKDVNTAFSSPAQNMMSIILNSSAYALESSELYRMISGHNQNLEEQIAKRTSELEFQYVHDSLTGLPNRFLFQDRLEQAMIRAQGMGHLVVVMLIDLDMFKRINDSFGHSAGDQLLIIVAERLRQCLLASDALSDNDKGYLNLTLARLGGDEFAVMLADVDSIDPVNLIIKRIVETLSKNVELEGEEIYTTCSIGVSVFPKDGYNTDTLIKNADAAMYHAKRLGRNHYQFYTEELNEASYAHLKLENQLRFAIERNEFFLVYQPKIDVFSGRIVGMEALIRWDHPEMGIISPAEFIPVAEYTGLINTIGEYVLITACTQVKEWLNAGFDNFRMAINLSPQQFRQHGLLERIKEIVTRVGVDPRYLEVEITEGAIIDDVDAAIVTMQSLHDLGIALSIDDFGTGYSSLSYLKRFPIDSLKIDQSFVRDITVDSDDASIVIAIIGMAHSMGLKVIAEGVETNSQLTFLQALKCDEIQGFLYSPPVSPEHFPEMFTSDKSFGQSHLGL
ncbi:MAG: EAL domain-containing protein [Gammaproteobacteria bacterium]|nr:EAL domain-containing protein [Gammaproteobacteria bacterium]